LIREEDKDMYFVYDKDGKKFRMNHRIDQRAAINTGKYSKNPLVLRNLLYQNLSREKPLKVL